MPTGGRSKFYKKHSIKEEKTTTPGDNKNEQRTMRGVIKGTIKIKEITGKSAEFIKGASSGSR